MIASAACLLLQLLHTHLLLFNFFITTSVVNIQGVHELRQRTFELLLKKLAHEI